MSGVWLTKRQPRLFLSASTGCLWQFSDVVCVFFKLELAVQAEVLTAQRQSLLPSVCILRHIVTLPSSEGCRSEMATAMQEPMCLRFRCFHVHAAVMLACSWQELQRFHRMRQLQQSLSFPQAGKQSVELSSLQCRGGQCIVVDHSTMAHTFETCGREHATNPEARRNHDVRWCASGFSGSEITQRDQRGTKDCNLFIPLSLAWNSHM